LHTASLAEDRVREAHDAPATNLQTDSRSGKAPRSRFRRRES